jgi:probable rRNA maturation factor
MIYIELGDESLAFKILNKLKRKKWLKSLAQNEGKTIKTLEYTLLSDEDLLAMNIEHLQHDTYTDIITFDTSSSDKFIEGDIYISIDRVKENAVHFKVSVDKELNRVLAHGLLHLCGYGDKTPSQQKQMRVKEDYYLNLFDSLDKN